MLDAKYFKMSDGTPYLEIRLPNGDVVRRTTFTKEEQAEYDALVGGVSEEAGPTPIVATPAKGKAMDSLSKPL